MVLYLLNSILPLGRTQMAHYLHAICFNFLSYAINLIMVLQSLHSKFANMHSGNEVPLQGFKRTRCIEL